MNSTPLDNVPFISLRSFKRDGSPVDTPVWATPLEGELVIFTLRESFKVKRVGRNPSVQVAQCTMRGDLQGPWHDGTCRIVSDPDEEKRAYQALIRKYGMQMRIGNFFSALSGRMKRRVVMRIALAPNGQGSA